MTDDIRIVFPETSNIPDLVIPFSEVALGQPQTFDDGSTYTPVTSGNWGMELISPDSDGNQSEDDDSDPEYVKTAISAWASWWAYLQTRPADS